MITYVDYDSPIYGYISTGLLTRMYTLRIVYKAEEYVGDGVYHPTVQSEYIRNLSTDYNTALEKAKGILAMMGVEFSDNGEFSLEEIRRRKSDEVQKEREEKEFQDQILKAEKWKLFVNEVEEYIGDGKIVGGKYNGMTVEEIADIDVGYIRWFLSAFKEAKSSAHFANWKMFNKWADDNLTESEWVGNIGDVVELNLTFNRCVSFQSSFGYNQTGWVHYFEDENANLIKTTSTSKLIMCLQEGDKIKVTATVKRHDIDRLDSKVTLIVKPKLVK